MICDPSPSFRGRRKQNSCLLCFSSNTFCLTFFFVCFCRLFQKKKKCSYACLVPFFLFDYVPLTFIENSKNPNTNKETCEIVISVLLLLPPSNEKKENALFDVYSWITASRRLRRWWWWWRPDEWPYDTDDARVPHPMLHLGTQRHP